MSRPFKKPATLLVIEDDALLNSLLTQFLRSKGYQVESASCAAEGREILARLEPDLILMDERLPDAEGMGLIADFSEISPVIMMTAYGSVKQAVRAVRLGATDYLLKPVDMEELEYTVTRVLETVRLHKENFFLRRQVASRRTSHLIGDSVRLKETLALIEAIAPSDMTVLIEGESGVGKELVARELHDRSQRKEGNFVALDCCTLQEKLFESELFGHERGAFTGADRVKQGLIELADGGTLFLDEIGEIDAVIQAKLLRILETGKFRRLGGVRELAANVRIVAATNRDLAEMVHEGKFRDDLFYRLSAFKLTVPSLRERREDIPLLAEHFLHKKDARHVKPIRPAAVKVLLAYDWPGNVRELRNAMERAAILASNDREIGPQHFSLCGHGRPSNLRLAFDHEPTMDEIEGDYLRFLVKKYSGRRAKIAEIMGMSERNVYRLIQKHASELDLI